MLLGDLDSGRNTYRNESLRLFIISARVLSSVHTHKPIHTPVPFSGPKLILFQEMKELEVRQKDFHLSCFFFFYHSVKLNADILLMLKKQRACKYGGVIIIIILKSQKQISPPLGQVGKALQLCSLVWEQPEQPHSADSLVLSSVCFYCDRWGRVRRMWCSCDLISE